MSAVSGKVGQWELEFKRAPQGKEGVLEVQVKGRGPISVRWRADDFGLWLEHSDQIDGFDLEGERDENGSSTYRLLERTGAGEFSGLSFKRAGEAEVSTGSGQKKSLRVRSQMPGKIVRIHVKEGDSIQKGDALLVMEAMKMENEIRASHAGVVQAIKVSSGQAVETGADLVLVET